MALKDELMPKSTFLEAGTSLLKSYKTSSFPPYFHLVTSCYKLLAAAGWLLAAALPAAAALTAAAGERLRNTSRQ